VSSIVISYRREDTPGTVGWMHELLVRNYGKSTVYRDIDQIDAAIPMAGSPKQKTLRGLRRRQGEIAMLLLQFVRRTLP
jgi:hypothetical protein